MTRCPEECGKQWRPVQGKAGGEKQKEEEAKEEVEKRKEEKEKKKKQKKGKTVEIRKVVEEWKIWNEKEEAARSEAEVKKLVPERFHKWIKVFGKKQSERMPTRKLWDHAIDVKEGFVPKKGKVYPLSREERGSKRICKGTVAEGVYSAIKVTTNGASVFCGEEGWKEENGIRLLIFK